MAKTKKESGYVGGKKEKEDKKEKEKEEKSHGDDKKTVKIGKPDPKAEKGAKDAKEKEKEKDKGKGDKKDEPKGKGQPGRGNQAQMLPEPEEIPMTPSQIIKEEQLYRAMQRRQRFKRRWPEVTKVKIKTEPWAPPPRPEKMPKVMIDLPELKLRHWVPPFRRRRRPRGRLPRIPPEELTQPLYESAKLRKIWHNFAQVDKNKMLLQGFAACNNKKYSSTHCGSQTGCIAVVCRALLEEKTPAQLVKRDVDDVIDVGDNFYKRCMVALKCYKGKPQLQLHQLLTSFYLHDTKYTVKMNEVDKGILAKSPENVQGGADLMSLMEKRAGSSYVLILSIGDEKHFLIWGHPPDPEHGSHVKTICYVFDPHMLNDLGQPDKLIGAGGFIRYAGVTSFVMDFLANYGDLNSANRAKPRPSITLTNVEVVQKEPLVREPTYDLDFKALNKHCHSEWHALHVNTLYDKKIKEGQYPLASLSAVSLATSRGTSRRKMREFYQKLPIEPPPVLPVAPERPPPEPTKEQIMSFRGEDFFLYCPRTDAHLYGRDDLVPLPKSETILHSPVDVADKNYHSQFTQLDVDKWILRGTRHFASMRYSRFKSYTGVACCAAALGALRRLRARAWCEDTVDETLDLGFNFFRESLEARRGPIRRLVLGELKDTFKMRNKEYRHKDKGIVVWGKLISNDPKVFDVCRGIEEFFKQYDGGILQVAGEWETAIWHEGDKYYIYQPWPADRFGKRVSLQGGGKACVLYFTKISRLCEHFLENTQDIKRKPFSISDVGVYELGELPQPVNNMKPIGQNRWIVRGHYHEGDECFPPEHRNKQATPTAIAAVAMKSIADPAQWTPDDVDETLVRGDILYQNTMENLEKMGINFETPTPTEEEIESEEGAGPTGQGPSGTLAAADVLPRFKISEYDCIETDVLDSPISGTLNGDQQTGLLSLKDSLKKLFGTHQAAVLTARGGSVAVWEHDNHYYMFDPHGCDENGLPSDDPEAAAALIRVKNDVKELTDVIMGNLPPGSDDSFNLSPVDIIASKLNAEIGAAELTKLENKAFEWINRNTAEILMGPRGENSAIGKAARKSKIPDLADLAGRTLALPAAAAFCAASTAAQPPGMHQDHMYNFLDAGSEYYQNHVKKTGRKDITVDDLSEKFEMGANTFSIELGEFIRLPLRLPDQIGEGGEEEGAEKEMEEGAEEMPTETPMREMKDLLFKQWYDNTKPAHISLLLGDYHQLGVWMAPGGKVVVFDPAPTLYKGMLTPQRIAKGDALRLQRLKDEMTGEDAGEEADDDEEAGGEGEEKPEPEPEFVPPESCPVLMVFATPGEFIDKLVAKGTLDPKQMIAPYWLYPVTVTNELTSLLKDRRGGAPKEGEGDEGEEAEDEALVEALDEEAVGKYFDRVSRAIASLRGRVAQNENYFMDQPNRDNQDAANAAMGIVVEHIEPYIHWKPQLIDAILKYGDRLYTTSLPNAAHPPKMKVAELQKEFHVTMFNVKLEVEPDVIVGDVKAGDVRGVYGIKKGIQKFFEAGHKHGVICCKGYCVAVWQAPSTGDGHTWVCWEPHPTGPRGRGSPGGAAALVLLSNLDDLADTFKANIDNLNKPATNAFTISAVKVFWEFAKVPAAVSPQGATPDEGYEWKVLTGYVELARGRTILRGSRPADMIKFTRESLMQSACGAIVASAMTNVRRPHLWTRRTVDEVMCIACQLFTDSVASLGYEFRPEDDVLLPLQVVKRFRLGVNYIRFDLVHVNSGKLEQKEPTEMTVRAALERFFESHTHGILWSTPYCVAVWRVAGAPGYYMCEPHATGATGLRIDAEDDGAACVMTFTSPKLMAFAYLQNTPTMERTRREFSLYAMPMSVLPIRKMPALDPPLVKSRPGLTLVPATSKVGVDGSKRRADEGDRRHPPGSTTCLDAQRATDHQDKEDNRFKGIRNTSGWLVLNDGTQFLSAQHSMACKKFPYNARNHQSLACSVMAVAMSCVEDVCRWCNTTLDQILESGDQLYQDSYLHYRPRSKILSIDQILRKFYTPGNCVCRVVVYKPRQQGQVDDNLYDELVQFFREEKAGVLVAGEGDFAVALFRTPRGFYMFDPADRDRYGRAVAPACVGRARACFSQYPNVKSLADKLLANVPPVRVRRDGPRGSVSNNGVAKVLIKEVTIVEPDESDTEETEPASFSIYGMGVSSLRRLNQHEK